MSSSSPGDYPDPAALTTFYAQLPKLENSPLPALSTFLPKDGLVANSERYILGPVSLQRVEPAIPPSVAGFHMGAEGPVWQVSDSQGVTGFDHFRLSDPVDGS